MTAEDWEAWCDARAADDEPPGSGWDDKDEDEPDPGPGERVLAAGFAKGGFADGLPGGGELAFLAGDAAGDDDRYPGASDGELDGMPERWDEFAVDELRVLLAESKAAAERLLDRAQQLATRLPGTMAVFRSGRLRQSKVTIIVEKTAPLDDQESRATEEGAGPGGPADPGRAARRGREGCHGRGAGQGEEAAGGRGEGRPGGAVGRGLRQRRADGPGAAAG
jgi:hypothetical protein